MFMSIQPPSNSRARLLWTIHTHPGISRAEIAQESGLSKAAISAAVSDLLNQGLVVEGQTSPSTGGRRRIGLQINQRAGLAVGVEIACDHCTAVLTDLGGQPIKSATRSFKTLAANDAVREAARLVKNIRPRRREIVGVGISIQGIIDAAGETALVFAPPSWAGEIPLAALLRERLGWDDAPGITLINSHHASALAEHRNGAGHGAEDVLFVSIGTSIGAGLVLAGELYTGSSGSAGEVGHLAVDPNGPRCACGNLGCLEALAGETAVIALTAAILKQQGRSRLLTSPHASEPITLQATIEAASAGDMAALAAVRQAGEYAGQAIAGLVNTLNPSRVVIGGQLVEAGDTLLGPLRQAVLRRASPAAYSTVEIVPAVLGQTAAAIGAAILAIDRYVLTYL